MFGVMPLGWIGNPAQRDIGIAYMELVDYQQWLQRQLEKISGIFFEKVPSFSHKDCIKMLQHCDFDTLYTYFVENIPYF